jgi:hypothetical protein
VRNRDSELETNIFEVRASSHAKRQEDGTRSFTASRHLTIHLLVLSPLGSKLFLLLPLHFHKKTSSRDLMLLANQCKPHRIFFHP